MLIDELIDIDKALRAILLDAGLKDVVDREAEIESDREWVRSSSSGEKQRDSSAETGESMLRGRIETLIDLTEVAVKGTFDIRQRLRSFENSVGIQFEFIDDSENSEEHVFESTHEIEATESWVNQLMAYLENLREQIASDSVVRANETYWRRDGLDPDFGMK